MLPVGRLLVSRRTSGSLNQPLAALTSGAHEPPSKKAVCACGRGVMGSFRAAPPVPMPPSKKAACACGRGRGELRYYEFP